MRIPSLTLATACLLASQAPAGTFTYTIEKASNPDADQLDAYARIAKAMDTAVDYYNDYTGIRHHVTVRYDPSVPTADDGGAIIRFGSERVYMVALTALHGISHSLGVGNGPEYAAAVSNGRFNGPRATAALRRIERNDSAYLNADAKHIWPHGLNFANEAKSPADLVNHCRIVGALYRDLFNESVYLEGRLRNFSTKQCVSLSGGALSMGSCSDSSSFVSIVAMDDSNPVYRLELGDQVLDAPNQSVEAGLAMGIWPRNRGANQHFRIEESPRSGGRASRLRMVHSDLYLHPVGTWLVQDAATIGPGFDWELIKGTVASGETTYLEGRVRNMTTRECISLSDTVLAMGDCADTSSFARIVAVGDTNPAYRLELAFRVLDAPNKTTQAGSAMGAWAWNGGTNQQFRLEVSPQPEGGAVRLKMVHSKLYLHPAGNAVVQDVAAGSGFDWELIKWTAPVSTGSAVRPPSPAQRGVGPRVDALGRRFPGPHGRLPGRALGTLPSRQDGRP